MRLWRALLSRRAWRRKGQRPCSIRSERTLDRLRQAHLQQPTSRPDSDCPRRQALLLAKSRCPEPSEFGPVQSALGQITRADRPSSAPIQAVNGLTRTHNDGFLGLFGVFEWTKLAILGTDLKDCPSTLWASAVA